jgi:hypothetical protein
MMNTLASLVGYSILVAMCAAGVYVFVLIALRVLGQA